MVQKKQPCNPSEEFEFDFIDERCTKCGRRMTNTKYIFYDLESGNYVCKSCAKRHNFDVVECMEY